ncbi:MAG: carboxypeptidase regulatory-like domain-containing protein [Acidobacteria bacterium]|nr:carboxypeptidase regulatory-like domain-containing protein [Acidobacteriota bacterium]
MRNHRRSTALSILTAFSLLLMAAVVCLPGRMQAQTTLGTSSVAGTVRDASSSVVAGAHVVLIDKLHGTQRDTVTNGDGGYQFIAVLPGTYAIRVEQPGFQTTTVDNIVVAIDQVASVNPKLSVGEVSQVVEVNDQGGTPLLDTISNALGEVMENRRVEELPLNGRNFLQLANLVGGTQPNTVNNQTGHNNAISVAGASQWLTGYNIDGIATRSPRLGNSSLGISVAAIDQFKIELGFFLPDKGPQVGIVDVLTKAGTNKYHGEVYEYVRNPYLNAHSYFDQPHQKESIKRNQFGFSIGGPVAIPGWFSGRDKFWFFGNYEGTRQITRNVSNQFVPTAANFAGDFSNLLTPQDPNQAPAYIYNPFSYNATTHQRAIFPGNVIPPSLINPVAKALLAYYIPGSAKNIDSGVNLTGYTANTLRDDQFTIRLDNAISQNQSIYVNFSYQNSPVRNTNLQPLKGLGYPLEASLGVIQHTVSLGSHWLNVARIGFNHAYTFQVGEGQGGPDIENQIGIPGTLDPHGIPNITLTNYTGPGNAYSRVGEVANAYQINEALNYTRGTHNISFGVGIVDHRVKQQNANAGAVGSLAFQGNYTKQFNAAGTAYLKDVPKVIKYGDAFADFLLGLPQSGSVAGFQPIHYYFTDFYPYFQDSWRITPHFTVNYGASWYYSEIPKPQGPDALLPHSFDFSTGLLKYSALGEVRPQVVKEDYNNIAPRLGFVYSPPFDPNTTFRAGVGLYYGELGLNDVQYGVSAPPFSNSFSFQNVATANLPERQLGNGVFPVIVYPPLTKDFAANLPKGASFNIFDENNRTPYLTQWTASIQHTFGHNDLIQFDYIGNSSHKNPNRYNLNMCPYRADLFCDLTKLPYPQYGTMSYVPYNTNSNYEALITKYRHQVTHGLTLLANFTWQKALSDGFEPNTGGANGMQSLCRTCEKGPTTYNIPLSFVVSSVYDLPFGRGKTFGRNAGYFENFLIGGWRLSVIGRMDHGMAASVTATNVTNNAGVMERADRVPGCYANVRSISKYVRTNNHQYFNTACYSVPDAGYFGTSGKGSIYEPGQDTWDASLVKGFIFTERVRLEMRGEFFNVFNHANFIGLGENVSNQATFGIVTNTRDPRIIQVAGILRF